MGNLENVTLDELREKIATRRYNKLARVGCSKKVQRKVTVHTTEITDQPATSYKSFTIRKMGYEDAIALFNAGGSQVAKIVEV